MQKTKRKTKVCLLKQLKVTLLLHNKFSVYASSVSACMEQQYHNYSIFIVI